MKKMLPVGIHDFKELIENGYYYVDKTLLLKEIAESGKVLLASRPRRFGKTLNISMLRYFYEISDQKNDHLFVNTAIWKHDKYRTIQGQHPVIFLTFKSVVFSTLEDTYEKCAALIAAEFNRHKYLITSELLEPFEKEIFDRIRQGKASKVELSDSLEYLVKFLHRFYRKKVVVLIDEYDVPVQSAFIHNFYDEMIDFLRPLLTSAFKDNELLEKGVLTGILTLAKAGIFTGLNNLDVFNLTNVKLADKFGFTQTEVQAFIEYYDIEQSQDIKAWYNGYIFGTTHGMYNPWSVIKCIQNMGALEIYWANTSDNILLKRLIARATRSIKSELESLLTGHTVSKPIEESFLFPNLDHQQELIWSLLLFTGYLTYTHYELKEGKKVCSLVIPNQEIQYLYEDLIKQLFIESVMGGQAQDLLSALIHGETAVFSELLQSFILNSMSAYDLPNAEPEKSYHLFVLGLLVMLSDHYEIKSNRESGLGRYDIMVIPKDVSKQAIIIEFKKISNIKETLEDAAQKALAQIMDKKYVQELHARNIHSIIAYGIAFEGKNLHAISTIINQ